ncbi:MAG: response regulator [Trueperaceae bacterium]
MAELPPKATVLVADDSDGHRKVIELLLSAHNYDVVAVTDGHEALTYLQGNTPHVGILDVNMPFMTGIEVCKRVKRISRLRSLPMIIMTSLADSATQSAAEDAGADLLVHKPLAGKSLPQLIKQAVDAAALRVERTNQARGDSPSSSSRV